MIWKIRKWWATRCATTKALRGEPLNWLEVELIKERFKMTDKDFQTSKP